MQDIYFDEHYGKLYEKMEDGVAESFLHESDLGTVKHQFIRRRIPPILLGTNEEWYDIVTAYGYGGPMMEGVYEDKKTQLAREFERDFAIYCKEHKIIAEFVRFHPLAQNALDFKDVYQPIWDRHTLGTNLRDYKNPVESEFTKHCRKHIRQALNKGVFYRFTERPSDLRRFQEIYYDTMNRNEASEYYFFGDEYFDNCVRYFRKNLLLIEALYEEKVIAAGLYFLYNKTIHVHLSGTRQEFLFLSPAYILRYALTLWGKSHGYEMIHHGGGRTNQEEDSLYQFKKQFAQHTEFDFYIGKKVWNLDKYNEICKYNQIYEAQEYFPAYRAKG